MKTTRAPCAKLAVEAMESRTNPAVYTGFGDTLFLEGTDADDRFELREINVITESGRNDGRDIVVTEYLGDQPPVTYQFPSFRSPSESYPFGQVLITDVEFNGYGGNDTLVADTRDDIEPFGQRVRVYAVGWAGDDILTTGGGPDLLIGGPGVDQLYGGQDDDSLLGGDDNDYLDGSEGSDRLRGEDGNDVMYGDTAIFAAGNDVLYGGAGNDEMDGSWGNDILYGEDGNDVLRGGRGAVFGSDTDDDYLFGGAGRDRLNGQAGNDVLDGGFDDGFSDELIGGPGADAFRRDPYFLNLDDFTREFLLPFALDTVDDIGLGDPLGLLNDGEPDLPFAQEIGDFLGLPDDSPFGVIDEALLDVDDLVFGPESRGIPIGNRDAPADFNAAEGDAIYEQ